MVNVQPISYKIVIDRGNIRGVELWQENRYVFITLAQEGTHENGYRWPEVQEAINKIKNMISRKEDI